MKRVIESSTLYCGDSREVLKGLPGDFYSACVTDPPYALESIRKRFGSPTAAPAQEGRDGAFRRASKGFMGMQWDNDIAFDVCFWAEVFRVCKPGAHVLAFGGTRTHFRMACAMEDAGFVCRDTINCPGYTAWTYGSGFPKNHRLPNEQGTALKPSWEPIYLFRKPLSEPTLAANVERWGCAGLNIDACRIPANNKPLREWRIGEGDNASLFGIKSRFANGVTDEGRWPSNTVLVHSVLCDESGCHESCPCVEMDRQSGVTKSGGIRDSRDRNHQAFTGGKRKTLRDDVHQCPDDEGGASRFFARFFRKPSDFPPFIYTAKSSTSDRERGLEDLPTRPPGALEGHHDGSLGSITMRANIHPTCKPTSLMAHLIRLCCPPGGIVLDPFLGSGSTLVAAAREGFAAVGIEMMPDYYEIACRRVEDAYNLRGLFREDAPTPTHPHAEQGRLEID